MKKILKIVGISLIVLFSVALTLPFLFKDKIVAKLKTSINENINAKVDFSDVDISLFRGFPKINLRINDLSVVGNQEFEGVSLLNSKYFDVNADFWSVIAGSETIPIKSIHLEAPVINILVLQNEKANYDITKPVPPTAATTTPSTFKLALEKYSLSDATLTYDDRALDFFFQLAGCDHTGKGEFTSDIFDLVTKTYSKETNIAYGGVSYINKAKADAAITLNADMKNMKFTLKDNIVKFNDFTATGEGSVQVGDVDMAIDMKFASPQADFKNLLSIIPSAYTADFEKTQANGKFEFNGFAKGIYNEKQYPAFGMHLEVNEASFKYPTLPLGVSNIATKIDIKNPEGADFDRMTVDIPTFNMSIGNTPLAGYFYLKTPISDPDVDTKINGSLNLSELSRAFPVASVSEMNGIVSANIVAKTKMSYIDNKQYEKVNMAGALRVQNMNVQPKEMPKVKINDMAMNFTPNNVALDNFNAQLGKSDVVANGKIDNILAYFSPKKTMKGNLTLRSNYFDASEWMQPSPTPSPSNATNKAATTNNTAVAKNDKQSGGDAQFDRFDFSLDATIGNLKYDTYNLLNTNAIGHFTPKKVIFENMSTKIGESDLKVKGVLDNVFPYLFDNDLLIGDINVSSSNFNLNQFMTPEGAVAATPSAASSPSTVAVEPLRIPKNVAMNIVANMGNVVYTNMTMKNLSGVISVEKGIAKMQNTKANTLGGVIVLDGMYDSTVDKPKFDMTYHIQNFDFQQAFNTFNTFAAIAPIGKYMQGQFNSTMKMSGALSNDMMPDLNTLTAEGFLHTLQALISGIKPITDLSNQLNIKDFVPLSVKDSKNWFEVKNGALLINPFDFKAKDIAMNMTGSHSFANEMNYVLKAKVPRKLLEKNAISAAANTGMNLITKEASKYGVNVKNGEFVNCQFTITGSMANPKLAFKLLGTDGETAAQTVENQVNAIADKAKDSVKTRVEQELKKAEDKARDIANKAADSLKIVANREKEKAIEKGKEAVKEQVGKIDKQLGDKASEVLGDKAGQKANEAIEKGKGAIDKLFKKKN